MSTPVAHEQAPLPLGAARDQRADADHHRSEEHRLHDAVPVHPPAHRDAADAAVPIISSEYASDGTARTVSRSAAMGLSATNSMVGAPRLML